MDNYPVCEKFAEVSDKFAIIKNFITHLEDNNVFLESEQIDICGQTLDNLIYDFFDVDPKELEKERSAMLGIFQSQMKQADRLLQIDSKSK